MSNMLYGLGIVAGLLNVAFIPTAIYWLWVLNGRFSFREQPLSLASKSHTQRLFGRLIAVAAILETLFVVSLLLRFPVLQSPSPIVLLVAGMLFLLITGVVSYKHLILHRASTVLALGLVSVWSLLTHIALLGVSPVVAYTGLCLSALALLGVPLLYLWYKSFGMSELLFAGVTMVWNVCMIALLVR